MRRWLPPACFLTVATACLAGLVPVAPAQAPSNDLEVADKVGDVYLGASSASLGPYAIPWLSRDFDYVDIERAWMGNETRTHIEVGLQVVLHRPGPALEGRAWFARDWEAQFRVGDAEYRLRVERLDGCPASLDRLRPGSAWYDQVACYEIHTSEATRTEAVRMDRMVLVDDHRVPAGPLTPISDLVVTARTFWSNINGLQAAISDRAPDTGVAGPFTPAHRPGNATGTIFLASDSPIRASNGESTTLVYRVSLRNDGTSPRTVAVTHETNESSFHIRTPSRLNIEPRQTVEFPVVLSMGFTHRHGAIGAFQVHAHDLESSDQASLGLGVYWLEVPQPAGHHPDLWLHTAEVAGSAGPRPSQRYWMNALQKDPSPAATDDDAIISQSSVGNEVSWRFPLAPPLAMGLDFDLGGSGVFQTRIRSPTPISSAVLHVDLQLCRPSEGRCATTSLASGESASRAYSAGQTQEHEVPLAIAHDADLVVFQPGMQLVLRITLRLDSDYVFVDPRTSPTLATKASRLTLPLFEYHDPVEQSFLRSGALHVAASGPVERAINPGRTAVFAVQVQNAADQAHRVRVSLEGFNAEWAWLVGAPFMDLLPGSSTNLTVGVRAPDDAGVGERAEFFVVAESMANPEMVALLRLRAKVVSPEVDEIPDELSVDIAQGRTSATSGVALVAVLLGVAVLVSPVRGTKGKMP